MAKNTVFIFGLFLFFNTYAFADYEEATIMPQNIITIDMALPYSTLLTWAITGNPFFGIAVQYERQILENFSVAGRLDYRGMWFSDTSLSSFSAEGHGRFYPEGNRFFINGVIGYAYFNYFSTIGETINSMSHYLKLGAKFGWRIDFGKPGGLVLEPSFGYYHAIGNTNIGFNSFGDDNFFTELLNDLYSYIIRGYFVGGLQISLGLGYRF